MNKQINNRFESLKLTAMFVGIFWMVHMVAMFLPIQQFGIHPRSLWGLFGIFTSPFLHGSFEHLMGNTMGFIIFGAAYSLFEGKNFLSVIWSIIILEGIATFVFGATGNHIGASGLIYGLFGFTISVGLFHRDLRYIILSMGIAYTQLDMVYGMLPFYVPSNVSWEGHLFGAISGVLVAWGKKNFDNKESQLVRKKNNLFY